MKRWLSIMAAVASALCESAWAASVSFTDPYVELSAGVATKSKLAFEGVKASLDSGPAATLGFGFANFVGPVDLRLDYATTDRDSCSVFSCAIENQGVTSTSLMLSALYNISVIPNRMDAYVGPGAGMVKVDVQHTGLVFAASDDYSGSDDVFGWQLIAGGRVKLLDGPVHLFFEYRYQSANDARVQGHTVEYNSNSFTFGARWKS